MPQEYGTSNFFTLKELDHSSGHAFLSAGGDIFYSPNCSRRVDVPVAAESNIFPFPNYNLRFETFLSPRWWRKPYHYFSFIPLRPLFDGPVFGCLQNIVTNIESVEAGRWALASRKVDHWVQVEDSLITVAYVLNQCFFTRVRPALHPTPPSFLGFKKSFSTFRTASLRVAASRDWFLMWMTLISSKIADIETAHEDWFSRLVEKEVPQDWLSAVQSSIVCDFSQHCPRVGTFLDIQNPESEQPSVEWFYSWDIPVWYCPGRGNPKLQPPPHLLQLATTFMSSDPCPSPPSQEFSAREYEKLRSAYLATKPWEAFFASREVKNRKHLANETPAERQTRLNREKKPPTKSADVFLWDWSADGAIELVRERVTSKEREDILSSHSSAQCKYDAVLNVWEVCVYFGPDDPNPDNDDYDYDGRSGIGNDCDNSDVGPNTDPDIFQKESQAFIDERVGQSSTRQYAMTVALSSDQGPEVDLTHGVNQINVLQYMSHYYGFVPPLPIPAADTAPIGRGDWDECLKSVGLQTSTHNRPLPGLTGPIVNFIKRLQGDGPQAFEWDILPGNRQPLNREAIVQCFHKLNDRLFLINSSFLVDENLTDWQIAVTTSTNALYTLRYILHSSERPSSAALAQHLAEEGIPFYTLLRLGPLLSSIPLDSIKTRIPRRGANYHFTPADFGSYIAERKQLLATPRARAAILCGGIVGRLAKEHLEADSVVFGPSSAVTSHRLGYLVQAAGTTYWDDGLTADELAIICGLYCCYTGVFSCFLISSSNYI
jgi:hypothetical protein